MQYRNIQQFYFSATGTTRKVVQEIGRHFESEATQRDLLREPLTSTVPLAADSLAIIGMPVYCGRIPEHCAKMLENLKGTNTPAIAVVVYGNREYDDALLELTEILNRNGFLVFGAGAFVAQHSIVSGVAKSRPDESDLLKIEEFSRRCGEKLRRMTGAEEPIRVKGNSPYKPAVSVPLKPSASHLCTACGVCAELCPTGAISKENPLVKNKKLCISCAACVAACPHKAQAFRGILYTLFGMLFQFKCRARREPETFV